MDEPQYYRWGTPYTKMLAPYFQKAYGEDILDGLGLLFVEKKGYRPFRYKFWKAMQALMLENFAKRVYTWCDEHGYKLTGHYIEETTLSSQLWCCGGCMPFYEFEHIPGIDWLGRGIGTGVSSKQVASVAAQLGKKQVLTETFACCGWDVTPNELKRIAEHQYIDGINLMCQHLLPFTEHGQRKRDYPAHYSEVNPWVKKNFKQFNDYFSVLGKLLAESEEEVCVGMLHPMRSAYFNYKREQNNTGNGVAELQQAWEDLTKQMGQTQIQYHYLDETLLAKYGRIDGKKLVVGKCSYEYIVFPKIYTMDKTTERLLREFVKAGGKVLLTDEKPAYLEGEEYAYEYLETNTSWEEIKNAQPYKVVCGEGFHSVIRKDGDGKEFIYAANFGKEMSVEFTLKSKKSFTAYDILKDEYTVMGTSVHFDENQSYILYLSDEVPKERKLLAHIRLGEKFTVCNAVDNYLTLDFVRYSKDGVTYSEPLHHMGVFDEMLKQRYKGKLYLKYQFVVDDLLNKCTLLAEDTNTVSVEVNGEKVERYGSSVVERDLYAYDVAKKLRKGLNEVVIVIDYYQSEQVYYALFGEDVTESLKNCLVHDTDIEAIYLKGDFGVYGDFLQGNSETVVLGENFRLRKQQREITSLIEEGYPFFAGDITLKQTIITEDTDCELVIDKRFHLLDIKVNGKQVGRLMFGKKLDLSNVLKKGENELELTLTVGNRNLLGPFHTVEQENMAVGPAIFERPGTWTNGKSNILRESYAFVKTLL